ncbi:DUF6266 family protein [Pedobacter aquatilis]|uniref:DUF6266 family protein n=1 Tax=Pedobacter aquatilis TaxID=351343 RepID=UPI0029307E54|nr:DUF6266 family protein [Pedobacter aquatilis]
MAILNEGINGGFTGKVGSVIGYQLNGKWVIRGLPKFSQKNKIGTAKQQVCRKKFTLMQHFLAGVFYYIKTGFNLESKRRGISAHNAAKSFNMINAFNEAGEIDYSKIILTYGVLEQPNVPKHYIDDSGLHFSWEINSTGGNGRTTDQVMVLAYNKTNKRADCIFSGNRRYIGKETLEIPNLTKGDTFHTWISFISDDRTSISISVYIGQITY